jgi:polysaccharide pyruvyl transferase WcaK-like protein
MKCIGLLDPSLKDNEGSKSTNLGDIIIYDSVINILHELFGKIEIVRVSTHCNPTAKLLHKLNQCPFVFIGGTNLLSSDIKQYNQWKYERPVWAKMLYPCKNIILFGVGWWQYQPTPTIFTKKYYLKVLKTRYIHSVRDSYTLIKLNEIGFKNVINTSCPTIWGLDGRELNRKDTRIQNCVFTLTDYSPSPEKDQFFFKLLLQKFSGELFFFAQGNDDIQYLESLPLVKKNWNKIRIISSIQDYNQLLQTDIVFIGTRMHGGARALQKNKDALVLEIDNRSREISQDTNFPSIKRGDMNTLSRWIDGEYVFNPMRINIDSIQKWKAQFFN